jgi:3-oxoacyl-[acyl-carrier protein] reductase
MGKERIIERSERREKMNLELSGRVALVTGASKGIGKAIALAFAGAGVYTCILSRSKENLTAASEEIEKLTGIKPLTITGDVGDSGLAELAVKQVMNVKGRLDILVNNAEGPPMGSFIEHDDSVWNDAYNRCLLAPVRFSRLVVPFMKTQSWGRIINITSVLAKEPTPAMVLSATLRAGVSAFAKSISTELAGFGITVNTVCPSAVLTERMENLTRQAAVRQGKTYEEILDQGKKTIPMGRFSTPKEIADLVLFLTSERASYITGTSTAIDGGSTRSVF